MKMGGVYLLVCFQAMMIGLCFGLTLEELAMFKSGTYTNKNTGVQREVTIQENDQRTLLITSNGIPDHPTGKFDGSQSSGPNFIEAKTSYFVIPKVPKFRTEEDGPGCLPMGPIGVAINGISIYNPYTLTCCDAGQAELNLFDECWGHPSPQNQYHYHTAPLCLMKNYCNKPSSIIGVAFDGFPIYGPFDEDGKELTSKDLDECNGQITKNGAYRYHVTGDFPYFLNCYKGEVIAQTGLQENCECTEPKFPCEEFEHHGVDERESNKSMNEQLGLQKDGHFYCCDESEEDCPFVTNTNTGIETATSRITNSGTNAIGIGVGIVINLKNNNDNNDKQGNSDHGSNNGEQGGKTSPLPSPTPSHVSQGLSSVATSRTKAVLPQPKNNNNNNLMWSVVRATGGSASVATPSGVTSKPKQNNQNNFLSNFRQNLQRMFGFGTYNPTMPHTSTQPTGQEPKSGNQGGSNPWSIGGSNSGNQGGSNPWSIGGSNSGNQGGSNPGPQGGPKPYFMSFLRGSRPKTMETKPGQQSGNTPGPHGEDTSGQQGVSNAGQQGTNRGYQGFLGALFPTPNYENSPSQNNNFGSLGRVASFASVKPPTGMQLKTTTLQGNKPHQYKPSSQSGMTFGGSPMGKRLTNLGMGKGKNRG